MAVECSLLPRRPCRFGGARRPRAWCRRRPAALAAPRRAALVTSRALRGVFWHVSACHRRQDAWLPRLRPRASGRARQARRRSARVFELAARDEPAWLVARREPAQHALGTLYSLAKLSGKAYRARAGRLGRDGALNSTMTTSSRSGRRQRACAARCSTAGCSPTFQQCLLPRSSRCNRLRGPAPAASLRQRCLRLRHAHRLAARVACGGPAGRDARRERAQQAVQRSLTHSERR